MPFDVATLTHLEEALCECFNYHDQLDAFLTRAGVGHADLAKARQAAEQRARQSTTRTYQRAPKRFVVQELLNLLSSLGDVGDRAVAGVVTGLTRGGPFPDATPNGLAAVERLRAQVAADREERDRRRSEQQAAEQQKQREAERAREAAYLKAQNERDALNARFLGLMGEANAQSRGYLFEAFLNDLFALEGLAPRSSFKIRGEQIDGSFSWQGKTHLVEAKWVKDPVAGAEFGAFNYKIEGKTVDTRGLYISVNGYSPQAIQGLNGKGALRFVCIDGSHILRSLAVGQSLTRTLETVWRHASETGEAYFEVSRFKS